MEIRWSYIGLVPFKNTIQLMERLREEVFDRKSSDKLLLLQHHPVITRGSSFAGDESDITIPVEELKNRGIDIVDTDRGGKTVFHGPGQLVGYFIVDLKRRKKAIKPFVMDVANVLKSVLDSYGIDSVVDEHYPGLFVDGKKIAFLGFNVKKNVTTHGFALNINSDLEYFEYVVPCGLLDVKVTSMEEVTGHQFSVFDVYWRFITYLADLYGDDLEEVVVEDFKYKTV